MKRIPVLFILFSMLFLLAACTSDKTSHDVSEKEIERDAENKSPSDSDVISNNLID